MLRRSPDCWRCCQKNVILEFRIRCGWWETELTALLLSNGDFIACVYKGLVDDFARQAICTLAQKVFKAARKKFSKLIIHVQERQISAWDYYCYGLSKGNSAYGDKFISDFVRLALMKKLDAIPVAEQRLIEISVFRLQDIDETTQLRSGAAIDVVHAELRRMMVEYGASVPVGLPQAAAVEPSPSLEAAVDLPA